MNCNIRALKDSHFFLSKDSLNFDRLWFSTESKIVNSCQFVRSFFFLQNFVFFLNQISIKTDFFSSSSTSPQLSWSQILSHFSLLRSEGIVLFPRFSQFNAKKGKNYKVWQLGAFTRIAYVKKNRFSRLYMGQWVWRQTNYFQKIK